MGSQTLFVALYVIYIIITTVIDSESYDDWYDEFEFDTFIDGDEKYQVFWNPDQDSCMIEFGLAVEYDGWVGFGISESGGMTQSDIVVGWIKDNGHVELQNRYALSRSTPQLFDDQNGIEKISGWKEEIDNTTFTYLRFKKEMFPDFDPNNVNVKIGTTRVIFAYGDLNQAGDDITQHTGDHRGPQSMNLLQGEPQPIPLENDTQYFELTAPEHTIPDKDTTYWCTLLELPSFNDTQHVTRIDPVIDPPENEGVVHHVKYIYAI